MALDGSAVNSSGPSSSGSCTGTLAAIGAKTLAGTSSKTAAGTSAGTSAGNSPEIAAEISAGTSADQKIEDEQSQGREKLENPADISVQGKKWLSYSDLMSESYPAKSKMVYLKAYKLFERYLKSQNQWSPNTVPTDLQVLNYFHFLRNDLKRAPTTLWSTYARINAVMKRVYGVSLKSYSRVGDVLKSYDSGHVVKQASIFTPQQIEDFVSDPELSSKYWLVRKAVCLIGYYGGFRNIELKSLKFENVELDGMGYWFKFDRSKQRGHLEATCICIPRRQPDWIPVSSDSSRLGLDFDPASLIDLYFAEIENDFQCTRDELKGDFFRATHGPKGQKFTQLSLGKNTIGKVGVQVATELCLPRPELFTGHCWRRSCGTSASDSGVNVTTLMAMMGWSNPKTAMVYVKKSRMTSLSLSLYLTNVQRSNCSNPFPRSPLERNQVSVRKNQVSNIVASSSRGSSELKVDDPEVVLATQELLREIEAEDFSFDSELAEVESKAVEKSSAVGGSEVKVVSEVEKALVQSKAGSGEGEGEEKLVDSNSRRETSFSVPTVDPRMAGILHNLQNSGNVTINFNFDSHQK